MNNKTVGRIGAIITGLSVLTFAGSMIVGLFVNTLYLSCFSSIFIAVGFIPFMAGIYAVHKNPAKRAAGYTGILLGAIYAVIIFLVYFAECTTVRMNPSLSNETLSIISYGYIGSLFFNYDLLGYAFMGLSTFFVGFTVEPKNKGDKAFRILLWLHGIFFLSGLIVPLFPLFSAGASSIPGTVLLEIWCAYFLPVCILGYRYLNAAED